jgi:hypothetical protein
MGRIQWTRASQFNWVFDNMGGTPLQEAVAGKWNQAVATVQADGQVMITTPNSGGGQVYWLRGVWPVETLFPWEGFWADPISGDTTNYYTGGSFTNTGEATLVTLGTALPAGTAVQLYYIYLTGEQACKYDPLNDYPCIRQAYRGRDDYTYDFAVDRMLDLMALLHLAGQERGQDFGPLIQFLWEAYYSREASRTSPLMQDDFERQQWVRGAFLLYRDATTGDGAFQDFQTKLAPNQNDRALHVRVQLPATTDAAWFGYGLDWSLSEAPFNAMNRLSFTVQGDADTSHVHNVTKVGSGSATLVILNDYGRQEKRDFVVVIETTGEVGTATFKWSKDNGATWEATGLVSGDRQHPVILEEQLAVAWESGEGTDLVAGDLWSFWGGEPAIHPRRLLVTLNDAERAEPDPWTPVHTYVHAIPDRFTEMTPYDLAFSQFWRLDNIIDDADRLPAKWAPWYSTSAGGTSDITVGTREATEIILDETYYTQRYVTWDLSSDATAFGMWTGIDTSRCNSTGRSNLNILIKPKVTGASTLTMRLKVKDAQGSYFHKDVMVQGNVWQRVTVNLAEMALESGAAPLTHPIQVVDIGIPASPPTNGAFTFTDLKFDDHVTFAKAQHLKVMEFKMEQQGLTEHEWWLDNVALDLTASDPYPYAPRLAISLTPYGQNPWRGPTLVHYVQPLAPYLVGAPALTQTYLQIHADAQAEYTRRYGGVPGPIMPVHTRNDVENIALCGEEDFGRFSWWRQYRDFGKVTGMWFFNASLTDASRKGHDLTWSEGSPIYADGICQPGNTALIFDGIGQQACLNISPDFQFEDGDFTLEAVVKFNSLGTAMSIMDLWNEGDNQRSWNFYKADDDVICLSYSTDGANNFDIPLAGTITDNSFHHLVVTRTGNLLDLYIDGNHSGQADIGTVYFHSSI